jgi:hypothetical protein
VIVVAFHRQELAVADGGDHAATARAEVARGGEFADFGELQVLGCGAHLGNVEEAAEREPRSAAEGQLEQVAAADGRFRPAALIEGTLGELRARSLQRFIHELSPARWTVNYAFPDGLFGVVHRTAIGPWSNQLELDPLPCWEHLPAEPRRARAAALVEDIEPRTAARRKRTGAKPLGVAAYRAAAEKLRVGVRNVVFPRGSFPPLLPFVSGG